MCDINGVAVPGVNIKISGSLQKLEKKEDERGNSQWETVIKNFPEANIVSENGPVSWKFTPSVFSSAGCEILYRRISRKAERTRSSSLYRTHRGARTGAA